jgi:hypothetical protein
MTFVDLIAFQKLLKLYGTLRGYGSTRPSTRKCTETTQPVHIESTGFVLAKLRRT